MTAQMYRSLIRRYLSGEITAEELERRFMKTFQHEPAGMDSNLYAVLDMVCGSLDCYNPKATPESETRFEITEATLRKELTQAEQSLRKITK